VKARSASGFGSCTFSFSSLQRGRARESAEWWMRLPSDSSAALLQRGRARESAEWRLHARATAVGGEASTWPRS